MNMSFVHMIGSAIRSPSAGGDVRTVRVRTGGVSLRSRASPRISARSDTRVL